MAAFAGCPKKTPKTPACEGSGDCKDGLACIAKQCQICKADSDCGPGMGCTDGKCVKKVVDNTPPDPRKPCKVDDECAEDEDCLGGRCTKAGPSTNPDTSCTLSTIYFGFDKSAIEDSEKQNLDADGTCLEKEASKGVYLEGHTDSSGTEEYNIALSERRARTVADYLARLGIDPARMQVVPKGETQPSGNGDEKDRRVELQWK
ncbi:MAG TPA: OmpA family protein [Kofleriaceae bacterium]|nr:OmpA family protein [Kofleriaceae bacterium]